jgi:hypothetical protein
MPVNWKQGCWHFSTGHAYPILLGSLENDRVETRNPLGHFSVPVVQCRFRHYDQVRPGNIATEFEVSQEGDRLQSLSKTLL